VCVFLRCEQYTSKYRSEILLRRVSRDLQLVAGKKRWKVFRLRPVAGLQTIHMESFPEICRALVQSRAEAAATSDATDKADDLLVCLMLVTSIKAYRPRTEGR
jgi:uncharacterized membrane protein